MAKSVRQPTSQIAELQVDRTSREPHQSSLDSLIRLSEESFEGFCNQLSVMFGMEVTCSQQQVCTTTVRRLKKSFDKLTAVNMVRAEGPLNGTLQLVLCPGGLFTLGGVALMHPQQMILESIRLRSPEEAKVLSDVLAEIGANLAGSWNNVLHERCGEARFVQTDFFIGNPWGKEHKAALTDKEEAIYIPYEIKMEPYPAFKCGVIVPKTTLDDTSISVFIPDIETEEKVVEEADGKNRTSKTAGDETASEEPAAAPKSAVRKVTRRKAATKKKRPHKRRGAKIAQPNPEHQIQAVAEQADSAREQAGQTTKSTAETPAESTAEQNKADVETSSGADAPEQSPAKRSESEQDKAGPVSEAIQRMTRPRADVADKAEPAETPAEQLLGALPDVVAADIMQKELVWASPDESIEQALAKLQEQKCDYVMVGVDGMLEGIVSETDLKEAISPYLRPEFAKWRRQMDEATLKIKIKWVMKEAVCMKAEQTGLAEIAKEMCRLRRYAVCMVDQDGLADGLITAFDVLKVLLNHNTNTSAENA